MTPSASLRSFAYIYLPTEERNLYNKGFGTPYLLLRYSHDVPRYSHDVPTTFPRRSHDLPSTFLRRSYDVPTTFLRRSLPLTYTKRTISDEIVRFQPSAIMKAILNYELSIVNYELHLHQYTHRLPSSKLPSCYPLAIPLLSPYLPLA